MGWITFQAAKISHLVFTILLILAGIGLIISYCVIANYGVLTIA